MTIHIPRFWLYSIVAVLALGLVGYIGFQSGRATLPAEQPIILPTRFTPSPTPEQATVTPQAGDLGTSTAVSASTTPSSTVTSVASFHIAQAAFGCPLHGSVNLSVVVDGVEGLGVEEYAVSTDAGAFDACIQIDEAASSLFCNGPASPKGSQPEISVCVDAAGTGAALCAIATAQVPNCPTPEPTETSTRASDDEVSDEPAFSCADLSETVCKNTAGCYSTPFGCESDSSP